MKCSTTHEIVGKKAIKHFGLVLSGQAGEWKDKYKIENKVLENIIISAKKMGANAIVGITFNYSVIPAHSSSRRSIDIDVIGTAIKVK